MVQERVYMWPGPPDGLQIGFAPRRSRNKPLTKFYKNTTLEKTKGLYTHKYKGDIR